MSYEDVSASKEFWEMLDKTFFAPVNLDDAEKFMTSIFPTSSNSVHNDTSNNSFKRQKLYNQFGDLNNVMYHKKNQQVSKSDILIQDELARLQTKLRAYENSLRKYTDTLITNVRREVTEKNALCRNDNDQQIEIMSKWRKKMQLIREAHEAEEQRIEDDINTVCTVCNSAHSSHLDVIVFCGRCDIAVHCSCYHIKGALPEDEWYCKLCQAHIASGGSGSRIDRGKSRGLPDICCALCPNFGGAYTTSDHLLENGRDNQIINEQYHFKPENNRDESCPVKHCKDSYRYDSTNEYAHVHVACAQWCATQKKDIVQGEDGHVICSKYLKRISSPNSIARTYKCFHCKSNYGTMLRCVQSGCQTRFHVSCARSNSKMFMDSSMVSNKNAEWRVFCPRHSAYHLEFAKKDGDVYYDANISGSKRKY